LEFSFVPVPANQGVGPARGRSITFAEARALGIDTVDLINKGMHFSETLGYVPKNVSDEKASESTAWSKPSLKDFTDKEWGDLSDTEKKHIAGHFAWAKSNPAESFGDLKLPHHEAKSGAAVWNGVKAAMGALMGARGGVDVEDDKKAVYDHLAAHYKQFGKEPPEFKTLKEAQAGDTCTTDDGSPGVLTTDPKDPDGALVCIAQDQDKSAKAVSQKELIKAVGDEHERHDDEVDKCIDAFQKAVVEDQGDPEDANDKKAKDPKAADMRENLKDLRSTLADEHNMHRAKSVECFRSFDASNEKAFDKKAYLKALRDEHDEYEAKNNKALDEFEEKCMKSVQGEPGEVDQHTDWVSGKIDSNQAAHKKAVVKIAKAMCKAAFGEEDQTDEKTLAILDEFVGPHVDPLIRSAVLAKAGARISAATKERLGEAHQHLIAAKAVLESLHPGLADGNEEESRSDDSKAVDDGSRENRSRTRTTSRSVDAELQASLRAREIVGGIEAKAREALGQLNADIRAQSKK